MTHHNKPNIKSAALSRAQLPRLLEKLDTLLPYSIPLVRRIQFHLDHPISKSARIYIAVADTEANSNNNESGSNESGNWLNEWLLETPTAPESGSPWLAAHIDLMSYGQTQGWVFGSWEHPSIYDPHKHSVYKALMNQLFSYIYTVLVPEMSTEPPEDWLLLKRTGKRLTQPFSRSKVLFGTLSDKVWEYFDESARSRIDPSYYKYIFTPENKVTQPDDDSFPLPEGYRFGEMQPHDLQVVLDRTDIPRTLHTLSQYVSVSLFHGNDERPIGWGFLGKDASISSLHTEPEHRGKGLAVCLSKELLKRQGSAFAGQQSWGHADVSKENAPSRRVMEKLGGVPMWMVMWCEIDLEIACGSDR
ncbi:hypothetical protein PV11_05241 [Exophiala sideris]|uniref:N-acetyltransferase domain-containing protein n=1 Tax=Exophiala sideris TaxID=1016849 RepID=A0A0D1X643_9EURO|nr:hypothetical protein PV11_05241 [Exophiala sideris]